MRIYIFELFIGHLESVFHGSFEPVVKIPPVQPDHTYTRRHGGTVPGCMPDHTYSTNPSPALPKFDSSATVDADPTGWLNGEFVPTEVMKMLKLLKNNKAKGWDNIPNEALKNLLELMVSKLNQEVWCLT